MFRWTLGRGRDSRRVGAGKVKTSTGLVIALLGLSAVASAALWWTQSESPPRTAPDFTVATLDNVTFTLSQHRGEVVVLQFFAPWCVTCESTARAINQMLPEWNGTTVRVLTISTDPTVPPQDVQKWRDDRAYPWPFALDTDQVMLKYEVFALGRVVIVGPGGTIAFDKEGTVTADEFRAATRPFQS